jgi:hypothetical protein
MKPAPPVIIMFLTSGEGSKLVLPVSIGAAFQTPKSSKKLGPPLGAVRLTEVSTQFDPTIAFWRLTTRDISRVSGSHDEQFQL